MKIKSTKRALLMSVLSLLLCMSMLIGTTFAWFTDSVTSGKNTIQSGNLDVELEYFDVANNKWEKVTSSTNVFGYNLWEPGYTKLVKFRVINNGSLALKYSLTADVYSEKDGINKAGVPFKLSDYLYTASVAADATRAQILATTGVKMNSSLTIGTANLLEAGKTSEEFALAIWMPTTVGNEANHNGTEAGTPAIDFGINLLATQAMKEEDSFGNDYDKDAVYGDAYVGSAADLQSAIDNAEDGDVITLTDDIDLGLTSGSSTPAAASGLTVPANKRVIINLCGYTLEYSNEEAVATYVINNMGNLTINDTVGGGKIVLKKAIPDPNYGYATDTILNAGMLTINGGIIENGLSGASYAIDNNVGGTTIINGGKVINTKGTAVRVYSWDDKTASTLVVNGGAIQGNRAIQAHNLGTKTVIIDITINGGKIIAASEEGFALYSYSNGGSFKKTTIALNGGDYYGYVAFGGGYKGDQETVIINKDACSFTKAPGRYLENDGWEELGEANNEEVVTKDTTTLDTSLQGGTDVILTDDMTFKANETTANSGYGATGVKVDGSVLDGNGNTLTVNGANSTWDCAINTVGGTIKNITISGAMRGIFMGGATDDVYIDNVIFDDVIYTFNSDGGNKNYGVYISNSVLNGWTSFSNVHKEVVFTNCKFGEGSGYAFCRPYNATAFVGCDFEKGFKMDARNVVSFENCTIGGVALTAENLSTLVTSGTGNATVK